MITIIFVVSKYIIVVNKYIMIGQGLFMPGLTMIESSNDLMRFTDLKLDYSSD